MDTSENIVRYTANELEAMRQRGEGQTDWAWVDALTEEQLEASIDTEEEGEYDLGSVQAGIPGPARRMTVWFNEDVVAWFEAQGIGYKVRMNAVRRSYMEAQKGSEDLAASDAMPEPGL